MKDKLCRKARDLILEKAEQSAHKSAGIFCRRWIGVEPVPRALLEKEFQR